MKKSVLLAAMVLLSISNIHAQSRKQGEWHQRMMSEKIAFITTELELTPEEAQVFWPVYNQLANKKHEFHKTVKDSYAALTKALKEGTVSEKEIDRLLDEYVAAKQAQKEAGKGDVAEFRKVLPGKKVAKLYIAEEDFRRHHIRNMKGGHQDNGTRCPTDRQGKGKPGSRR